MRGRAVVKRFARLLLALCLVLPAAAADRIVAVGDVHGAYQEFVSVLQAAGVLGKDLSWTGGKTVLVQTGDVVDRGPESRRVLDLLMDLTDKARRPGGEVRPLLGNHEVMVMAGDLRYTSAEDFKSFATADSEKLRLREYENYVRWRKRRAERFRQPEPAFGDAEREAWMKAHPAGYFELRRAFGPEGRYGRWLRRLDTITEVDGAVFMHGGLTPGYPLKSAREINGRVKQELQVFDEVSKALASRGVLWPYLSLDEAQAAAKAEWDALPKAAEPDQDLQTLLSIARFTGFYQDGPLWYRGWAERPEAELADGLAQVLDQLGAKLLVMGHTVTPTRRITSRFNGKVMLIDTGMLVPYFKGRPSALEITGGSVKAIYPGEQPAAPLAASNAPAPAP